MRNITLRRSIHEFFKSFYKYRSSIKPSHSPYFFSVFEEDKCRHTKYKTFAGNCGLHVDINFAKNKFSPELFNYLINNGLDPFTGFTPFRIKVN